MKQVKWCLKTKLRVVMSMTIITPLLAMITFAYLFSAKKIEPHLDKDLIHSASLIRLNIETQLNVAEHITRTWAVWPNTWSNREKVDTGTSWTRILDHLSTHPVLQGGFVADSNGTVIASSNASWLGHRLDRSDLTPTFAQWLNTWRKTPNTAKPIFVGPYKLQNLDSSAFMAASLPENQGLLITQLSLDDWLPATQQQDETHRVWVVTSDHVVDLMAGKAHAMENWMTTLTDQTAASEASLLTYRNAQDQPRTVAAVNSPSLQGYILIDYDQQAFMAIAHTYTTSMLVLAIIFALLGITLSTLMAGYTTRPIVNLVAAANQLAQGNLAISFPVEGNDERATLAQAIASLARAIGGIVTHSDNTASRIALVQNEILSSCEEQAAGAREQASSVSQTSSAAAELSKTSEQIGENIKTISQMANHVLTGMEKIKSATDQTNQILTSLNEKSKQIGNITELIDDVADQTNLLAVNASIEAARAGEQGRGFTVVADQIGKLADSTAKSTKDITSLVEMIQHEMSNAIIAMEQSLVGVEEEIQLAKDSAAKSREIAMTANQQIIGSRQIADAMVGIETTMQQIATGAQRSANAASQLTGLADELKQSMTQFAKSQDRQPDEF